MEPDKLSTPPITQSTSGYNQPVKSNLKNKSHIYHIYINKYLSIYLVLIAIVSGVGAYFWRDSQANSQKSSDSIKIKTLEAEVAKVKSEAAIAAELNVMTRSYGDVAKTVADAYNSDFNHYPILTTDFKTKDGIIALPTGVRPSINDPVVAVGYVTFKWEYTGPAKTPTGGRITIWDFAKNKISDSVIYVGTANSKSTFITPTS